MCGIAGYIAESFDAKLPPSDTVQLMSDNMRHRGPDAEGIWATERVALGHRRLAVLDLSNRAIQPMVSANGRHVIVFNGELYNFCELRKELEGKGVRFHTCSDTEVLLALFALYGKRMLLQLRGMFAFAIWDAESEELFVARDFYGVKPLYYYHFDCALLFSSEVRALLTSNMVPRQLSPTALASYLQFGSIQDPLTIVKNVRSLLPGHYLSVKLCSGRLRVEEIAFVDGHVFKHEMPNTEAQSRGEAVTRLRSILEASVHAHLVSDVPIAAFLSGGIDSSATVALMSRVSDERPRTFNVSFDEAKFSERSYADVIARKFGTEHEDIRLTEKALIDLLPDALASMDQPTIDGINTYVVSKSVRGAGIKVALSGVGGDELFAGYPSFRRAMQLNALAKAPSAFRHVAAATGRLFTNGSVRHRKFWDLMEGDCSPYAAYAISRQLFAPSEIAALMRGNVRGEALGVRGEASKFALRNSRSAIRAPQHLTPNTQHLGGDVINEVSHMELTGYMTNTLLRDTDQMSMAHALEVRVPFVDREVIDYVMALPGEWKIDGERPKPLLLDALGDLLPEELWRRPKMGFTLPFERWMRSALQPEIDATFSNSEALLKIGLEPDYARSVFLAFKKNSQQQPWSRSWALYVLAKWCALNEVSL